MEEITKLIEIVKTDDDSLSIRRKDIGEGYHSTFGAIAESKHIFINSGLCQIQDKEEIKVLEIGFGTGLNAILTMQYSQKENQKIYYQTIEKYPLPLDIIQALNYGNLLNMEEKFVKLHSVLWNIDERISKTFILNKINKPAEDISYPQNYFDIIYMDAFAPQFEEVLWQREFFQILYQCLQNKGILITYCCKGDVKRAFKSVGFKIEKLPGPKGKREILKAIKVS